MIQVLTETDLAAIVGAVDANRFVKRTLLGCGCGVDHGAACPGSVR